MLKLHDRRLLLESLRPPMGYSLDLAVGTTFSLDLLALLTAPLAFTLFDYEDSEGRPTADPLALLEVVRRYADRISIFCQAGQIAIPKVHKLLYSYLEGSVFQVGPLKEGFVFHPKTWVLRFAAEGQPVLYRFLCLTRNLTFDRSWDTALVLDGELTDRKNAYASNHPLGDFVAALPRLSRRVVPEQVQAAIDKVQEELRRVRFELPPGFEGVSFWPLGIVRARRRPFAGNVDRMLVVSPFVSEACLDDLTRAGRGDLLVSRVESLAALRPECLGRLRRACALSDAANVEKKDEVEDPTAFDVPISGLHAKLYLAEADKKARVWTGSANATDAAYNGNVEFLVELVGSKSRWGIDAFLARVKGEASFVDLLQEFKPDANVVSPNPVQKRLDALVDGVRRMLARAPLVATAVATESEQEFGLRLRAVDGAVVDIPPEVTVRCWPITLREETAAMPVHGKPESIDFGRVSLEALTSFIAFSLVATAEGRSTRLRFVLSLPLEGAPADRQERVMRALLRDRGQVLRLLMLLLIEPEPGSSVAALEHVILPLRPDDDGRFGAGFPLFELLVRALDRDPARLDQVARLVEDLSKSPDGQQLLPEGFDTVWQPIWEARRRCVR